MKKTLIVIFIFFIFLNSFSQKVNKDLYLFITEKPVYEVSNDTIVFQQFKIDFESKNSKKSMIFVDDKGNLIKKITLKGTNNRVLNLTYKNVNSNNNPIIVRDKDVRNYLTLDEIIFQSDFESFNAIINNFNVYLINSKENSDGYYIARKVFIEKRSGL
jgi:hypothetical protein